MLVRSSNHVIFHFYPRPPRGGRPAGNKRDSPEWEISIHALREEGDVKKDYYYMLNVISIHALREEGDVIPLLFAMLKSPFLSTPSARRATS